MRVLPVVTSFLLAISALAQDAPTIKVGAQIFADYTRSDSSSAFNVTRAYINVTGSLNRWLAYRVTPDIARETGSGSSLAGSQEYRLKFAYAQFSVNDRLWIRGGLIPLLWTEYEELFYRYRFQGPEMVDREGFVGTADYGVAMRYALPNDRGDIAAGIFNGEGFGRAEANDQKAAMLRVSLQPVKGLRVSGFVDRDRYEAGEVRNRAIAQVAYEHPRVVAAVDVLTAKDRDVRSHGYSAWATPKLGGRWEALLRRDVLRTSGEPRKTRDIEGIAYWVPVQAGVSAAVMADRDATRGETNVTTYGLKVLVSF